MTSADFKVAGAVVCGVAVHVVDRETIRNWTNESISDQAVDSVILALPADTKLHPRVAMAVLDSFKQAAFRASFAWNAAH